jgi:hypothetical protein
MNGEPVIGDNKCKNYREKINKFISKLLLIKYLQE